jgi:hypothetical protein
MLTSMRRPLGASHSPTRRGKTGEAGGLQVRKRRLKRVRHRGAATTRHPDVLGVHAGVEVVAVAVFLEKGVEGRQEVAHRRMVAQRAKKHRPAPRSARLESGGSRPARRGGRRPTVRFRINPRLLPGGERRPGGEQSSRGFVSFVGYPLAS